jgi:hypothetical protein
VAGRSKKTSGSPGHPFFKQLDELLEGAGFNGVVEKLCSRFYHARLGRPSLRPGIYLDKGSPVRLSPSLTLAARPLGMASGSPTMTRLATLEWDPARTIQAHKMSLG